MKQINVMYSEPIMGCIFHIYVDLDDALTDSKKICKELGCTAVIMTVEYQIDKFGEAQ